MRLWRIVFKGADDKDWKYLKSNFYHSRGTAVGVLKRHAGLTNENWDEIEKVWVRPGGRIIYRIQHADIDWKDDGV